MDHEQVGRIWNGNAEAWTKLARAGYDVYRDHLNTPAFFQMLPDVSGLSGLDIGCGEGHNTRLLAKRGARVTAVDISEVFIRHARDMEQQEPLGIDYRVASAVELPFADVFNERGVQRGFMQMGMGVDKTWGDQSIARIDDLVDRTIVGFADVDDRVALDNNTPVS